MVSYEELMIGSLINYEGTLCEVIELMEDKVALYSFFGNHYDVDYEDIEGLPVSDTQMLTLGFVKPGTDDSIVYIHHTDLDRFLDNRTATFRFAFINGDDKLTVSVGDDGYGVLFARLKYVHELQRLWLTVTKEQLTEHF